MRSLARGPDKIDALAASANGRWIATGGDSNLVGLWDYASGVLVQTFPADTGVESLAFSEDSHLLAIASVSRVSVWDIPGHECLWSWNVGEGGPFDVEFTHDGRFLVGGGGSYVQNASPKIHVWDVTTGQTRWMIPCFKNWARFAVSPDGRAVAVEAPGGTIALWSIPTEGSTPE